MFEDLIISWRKNNAFNIVLLDALSPEALTMRATPRGRDVGAQFAHIHNVRVKWMEVKIPELLQQVSSIASEETLTKTFLKQNLNKSAMLFENLFEKFKDGIKAKGSKQSIIDFYSYMISHESHHRGQIILHLKLCKFSLESDLKYGLWNW